MVVSEAWQEMDEWCAKRSADLRDIATQMLAESEYDTERPDYRTILGQSQAFHQMRSFIHGAKAQSLPEPPQ